jgi:Domain of unknown function (DUF4326)
MELDLSATTKVVNVKVTHLRKLGQYANIKEWLSDKNNIYIGRNVSRLIIVEDEEKNMYSLQASIWHNPFTVKKAGSRENAIRQYRDYITHLILLQPDIYDLSKLVGKNLGCWCHPEPCHGDVLVELINTME